MNIYYEWYIIYIMLMSNSTMRCHYFFLTMREPGQGHKILLSEVTSNLSLASLEMEEKNPKLILNIYILAISFTHHCLGHQDH